MPEREKAIVLYAALLLVSLGLLVFNVYWTRIYGDVPIAPVATKMTLCFVALFGLLGWVFGEEGPPGWQKRIAPIMCTFIMILLFAAVMEVFCNALCRSDLYWEFYVVEGIVALAIGVMLHYRWWSRMFSKEEVNGEV